MTAATISQAPRHRGVGWRHALRHLWFRSPDDAEPMINEVAVRIRAGILLFIPLFMLYTLLDVVYGSRWEVTGNVIQDTFDTDFDGRVLYMVEAVRRVYDYTVQSRLLAYAFFEMIVAMFPATTRLSPTVWIASLLAANKPPVWKPLAPKRMAWSIGATMIAVCWIFFNPDTFAGWVNTVTMHEWLPTTSNYMPRWIPLVAVGVCVGFMWMETVLGVCVGCELHALLAKLGVFKQECEACNNLDFGAPPSSP
ncbi:DUF4395 family protein [Tibeticola sp.]|uniref:DUF4395 family protein n=1 Tax=Tibeticola sp. TaxID=2005368 RepID=UPI00258FCE4E|nr:DUF4395 family protein [Tibeticola sp.]MCI4440476.1 DUF4395 family protein [Tibeticola sp.]